MYQIRIQEDRKRDFMALLLEADPSIPIIERYLDSGILFVCRDGMDAVGVAVVRDEGQGTYELMNLAVKPEARGRGIGTLLMHHVIHWCRHDAVPTCSRLRLGTSPMGKTIMDFYGSFGFQYHHTREHFFIRNYPEPIIEDGGVCDDMIVLELDFIKGQAT